MKTEFFTKPKSLHIARRTFAAMLLLLVCAVMMSGCLCIYKMPRHVTLSGKHTTLTATPETDKVYRIEIDNMSFTNSKNVKIDIAYSETPSVEATINEDLLDYGFAITMKNGVLRVGPSRHLDIKTDHFELSIRARFDEIDLTGGYGVNIDAGGAESLLFDVSGAADGTIENLAVSDFKAKISGAGSFVISGAAERAYINVSGAGDIKCPELICGELETKISGIGSFELAGSANHANVQISGTGSVEAAGFTCDSLEARISGSGSVTMAVRDTLSATISGMGSVDYYGSPIVKQSVSGLGSVSQKSTSLPGA